jgi:hypothetical protein
MYTLAGMWEWDIRAHALFAKCVLEQQKRGGAGDRDLDQSATEA